MLQVQPALMIWSEHPTASPTIPSSLAGFTRVTHISGVTVHPNPTIGPELKPKNDGEKSSRHETGPSPRCGVAPLLDKCQKCTGRRQNQLNPRPQQTTAVHQVRVPIRTSVSRPVPAPVQSSMARPGPIEHALDLPRPHYRMFHRHPHCAADTAHTTMGDLLRTQFDPRICPPSTSCRENPRLTTSRE